MQRYAAQGLIGFLLLFVLLPAPAQPADDAPAEQDKLAMYRGMVGAWSSKGKLNASELIPGEITYENTWRCEEVLDGRAFVRVGSGKASDGTALNSFWVVTYDQRTENYSAWSHESGGLHYKMIGQWSADEKTMTWTLDEPARQGVSLVFTEDLSDPDRIPQRMVVKTLEGKLVADYSHVSLRVKEPAADADAAQEAELDERLAMYKPYAGKWASMTFGKPTEAIKEPYVARGQWVQGTVLAGRMIEIRGEGGLKGQEYKHLLLLAYDRREQAYLTWYHDSRGYNSKMIGKWSADEKMMTWVNDKAEDWGFRVTMIDRLTEQDTIRYAFKMVSDEGVLLVDETGVAERVRQERSR